MENIKRSITVYKKTGTEFLLAELTLPEIGVDQLVEIINPTIEDPLLYSCYKLSSTQLDKIFNSIPDYYRSILNVNFNTYEYYLEAYA